MEISDDFSKSLKVKQFYIEKATRDYITYLEKLQNDKYSFPVIMNICTYKEIKKMYFTELLEVNKLAKLRLEKEILEFNLEKVSNG